MAKLETNLNLEIKMQHATEKILLASTEAQGPIVMGQLEASSKRIQMLELEIQAYRKASEGLPDLCDSDNNQLIDSDTQDTVRALKSELERQIQEKKDTLESLESKLSIKKVQDEILALKRSIIKLKGIFVKSLKTDTIRELDSENLSNINRILSKYEYNLSHLDHQFTVKQFPSITDCSVCHEALWGNKNQGLECNCMFYCNLKLNSL
jgi:HAMP domain-containing protein